MNTKMLIEGFGYLGSLLVVISMLMTSVKKLRIVNTIGSVIFMIYALIIRTYPTALMNFCLVAINIYQIYQLGRTERHFHVIEGTSGSETIKYLVDYYADDIRKFFPDVEKDKPIPYHNAFLVICDAVPAGFMLGNKTGDGTFDVMVDYALPAYRDCSVGEFLYAHLPAYDIRHLVFSGKSVGHEEYLKKMGFTKSEQGYEKEL